MNLDIPIIEFRKKAVYEADDKEKTAAITKTLNNVFGMYMLNYETKYFLIALNGLGYDIHKDTTVIATNID